MSHWPYPFTVGDLMARARVLEQRNEREKQEKLERLRNYLPRGRRPGHCRCGVRIYERDRTVCVACEVEGEAYD